MRATSLLFFSLVAAAGCSSSDNDNSDGGMDIYVNLTNEASGEFPYDIPTIGDAAPITNCTLSNDADPVGLCVQKQALLSLHAHAFTAQGAAASWSSNEAGTPDKDEAGVVSYTLDDTVAYAAAAAEYLSSAEVYGDTTINSALAADLQQIALQLETSFPVPPTEYSGELYFHLRTLAIGLNAVDDMADAQKINLLAETYGRSILTAHYVSLGTIATGPGDAGHPADAAHDGGPGDASGDGSKGIAEAGKGNGDATKGAGDAGAGAPDGIIGNVNNDGQVAYSTADVATAAYALLDLVAQTPKDMMVPSWLNAARASLNHLRAHAVEPTTGMYYTALLTPKGGGVVGPDTLAPSAGSVPSDALLADTQATFALAMVRAQYLVTSNTTVHLTGGDADDPNKSPPVLDAGVDGSFVPILDIPFETWSHEAIQAMNGPHSLWDGTQGEGGGPGNGYMDGYIPSTGAFITSKSTRPNAFVAGAIARQLDNMDPALPNQLYPLVNLLISQFSESQALNSNLITVLPSQAAFLQSATKTFFPLEAGPHPTSYTTAAVTAAVEGLTEQLFSQTMM